MAVNIFGVVGIVIFYILILVIGLWAARVRNRRNGADGGSEEVMLAGRKIGLIVGTFTMTATWVGGGYINGTAEVVNKQGMVWAQSGWGYALSLLIGGFLFAKIMRKQGYVTMLDPFQQRYGTRVGGIMYIPAFLGELLWSAATLGSLGATISVVFELDNNIAVIVSACIAILYTIFGGLWSVAYTDVAQLICMFVGMWLTIPFAISHKAVKSLSTTVGDWKGEWKWSEIGIWIDYAFLLIFGGIPWQVYFQRVLSSKTYNRAKLLSYAASVGCIIMVIPPILIGAIGNSTDWQKTEFKIGRNESFQYHQTMPLVLQYLTPPGVSFIGLGAVSAAVMSSVDSSVLSASSMFAHNIYKSILRQNAGEREITWVIRISILVVGFLATCIGLTVKTIYGLSILCSDLIYVILFPQLVCVIYYRYSNAYGAVTSFCFGMLLRLLSGESMIGMRPVLKFPFFDDKTSTQLFPFRTFAMLITIFILWITSLVIHLLFQHGIIPRSYDIAYAFPDEEIEAFSFGRMMVTSGVMKQDNEVLMVTQNRTKNNSEELELMNSAKV